MPRTQGVNTSNPLINAHTPRIEKRYNGPLPQPFRQAEYRWRKCIASEEVDEAAAEFVDNQPARMNRQSFKSAGNNQDKPDIDALEQARDDEENGQEINEPKVPNGWIKARM